LGQLFPYSLGNYLQIVGTYDSKREDKDPNWNIHKCDLGLGNQTTKDQFSNVRLNDDQNFEHIGSIVLLLFLLVNFLNSIHLSFIFLALLIFGQIFSDHFSSAASCLL
jgi:hypothetical protein